MFKLSINTLPSTPVPLQNYKTNHFHAVLKYLFFTSNKTFVYEMLTRHKIDNVLYNLFFKTTFDGRYQSTQ